MVLFKTSWAQTIFLGSCAAPARTVPLPRSDGPTVPSTRDIASHRKWCSSIRNIKLTTIGLY